VTDDIDLSRVTILNSPDIHGWPATTQVTKLDLTPDGVHIEFTKKDGAGSWPDVPTPTPPDSYEYTLWIVLQIASSWWAAGCIEFFRGLDKNGGPVDQYAKNWYYDPLRWTPMTGHQPAVGERVGFLVTSGDARHGNQGVGLQERSNIVAVQFPPASGGSWTWPVDGPVPQPSPAPEPPPIIPVPPAPAPGDPAAELAALQVRVGALETEAAAFKVVIRDTADTLDELANLLTGLARVASGAGPA